MVASFSLAVGCVVQVLLASVILFRHSRSGPARRIAIVCIGMAAWAGVAAVQTPWSFVWASALNDIKNWLWLDLLLLLVKGLGQAHLLRLRGLAAASCGGMLLFDLLYGIDTGGHFGLAVWQSYCRIAVAVCGLLLVENVLRNGGRGDRWKFAPICLAAGAMFGADFYVFAEFIAGRSADAALIALRGVVLVSISPLVLLAISRNQEWRSSVRLSRGVVFYTTTLIAGGVFLFGAGAMAAFIGRMGGPWNDVLRMSFLLAAALGVGTVLSIGRFRSHIWRFINENFFSSIYDYRAEWIRFVDTLSRDENLPLQERVIRAMADVTDSPAGVLWLRQPGGSFEVARSLNMSVQGGASELPDSAFILAFDAGNAVQEFRTGINRASRSAEPDWTLEDCPVWLAVPLVHRQELTGFVLLAPARAERPLTWESSGLLLLLGRQIASYVAEEKVLSALAESRAIVEYSKRYSFMAHDIKNVAGQLSMLAANTERFGSKPGFQADLVQTLQHAAAKLARLIETSSGRPGSECADAVEASKTVAAQLSRSGRQVIVYPHVAAAEVRVSRSQLESALLHLLTNALEASRADDPVVVRIKAVKEWTFVSVEDRGAGMDDRFIRENLFKPGYSTKENGHGIGAYQAREIVRAVGGNLAVFSAVGNGTVIEISLPAVPTNISPPSLLLCA